MTSYDNRLDLYFFIVLIIFLIFIKFPENLFQGVVLKNPLIENISSYEIIYFFIKFIF